jgi:hypothetical protein
MPEGTLNPLQLQDIADLFAYLSGREQAPPAVATEEPSQGVDTQEQARRPSPLRK